MHCTLQWSFSILLTSWGIYFLNNVRKPCQIIYLLIYLFKTYLMKQKWMFDDYFENFTISHFEPPWNKQSKLADWCLGQFCSLISEKYDNLIRTYFFSGVIHKYYITQMMKTGQWYNYLVSDDVDSTFLELDFCDLSNKWWYLGHILADYSIMVKNWPIKLNIFFLVITRPMSHK